MSPQTTPESKSPFITMAEGGRMLGVSKSTFWQLVDSGAIPSVRVKPKKPGQRGGVYVHQAEVLAYRDQGRLPQWEAFAAGAAAPSSTIEPLAQLAAALLDGSMELVIVPRRVGAVPAKR